MPLTSGARSFQPSTFTRPAGVFFQRAKSTTATAAVNASSQPYCTMKVLMSMRNFVAGGSVPCMPSKTFLKRGMMNVIATMTAPMPKTSTKSG